MLFKFLDNDNAYKRQRSELGKKFPIPNAGRLARSARMCEYVRLHALGTATATAEQSPCDTLVRACYETAPIPNGFLYHRSKKNNGVIASEARSFIHPALAVAMLFAANGQNTMALTGNNDPGQDVTFEAPSLEKCPTRE